MGGGREPEDRGTTDIRSIQKRKEGETRGKEESLNRREGERGQSDSI